MLFICLLVDGDTASIQLFYFNQAEAEVQFERIGTTTTTITTTITTTAAAATTPVSKI
jgi:hypothetical protein